MRLIDVDSRGSNDPELALYRNRTIALLNKYLRMSGEVGHLPALMGREFFRSHVTHYGTSTFEDTVIFVHDMERCLYLLSKRHQHLVVTLFFQQYTIMEASELFGAAVGSVPRWRDEALDALSAILLERKLLRRMSLMADEDHNRADNNDDHIHEQTSDLPPKKPARGVRVIHAVAVPA